MQTRSGLTIFPADGARPWDLHGAFYSACSCDRCCMTGLLLRGPRHIGTWYHLLRARITFAPTAPANARSTAITHRETRGQDCLRYLPLGQRERRVGRP